MLKKNIPPVPISAERMIYYLETIKEAYQRINALEKENAELRETIRKITKQEAA